GGIPVFRPTMEQFADFARFVDDIYAYGRAAGIVKVIPPPEWVASLPPVDAKLARLEEFQPIAQHIFGSRGCYTQTNIESRKRYTVDAFRALARSADYRRPPPHGERGSSKPRRGRAPPTTRRASRRLQTRLQQSDASSSSSSSDTSMEEFSYERCQELERDYWRNLTYNPPLYGADIPGSLFSDSVENWNVAHLKNLLDDLPVSLPGVNSPYLYFGMWKSTFAWHVEDMDLFSINYIHFGAPKQWYSISEAHRDRFERVAQGIWSPEYQKCPEFLRHKTFIISPKALANYSIPVNRLVQKEHEFVLTFPRGYHAGYNLGYNCAESVNFALDYWIPYGKKARNCQCIGDSVHIDM
ncbi:JmjC domain, hydroxylase-domain-containing protein, partial [Syncephalis pseudoplumigaleata]